MTVKALRAPIALTAQHLLGLPSPCPRPMTPCQPPRAISPCPSDATAGLVSSSPQPCPATGPPSLAHSWPRSWPSLGQTPLPCAAILGLCLTQFSSPGLILTPTCRLMSRPSLSMSPAPQRCPVPWAGGCPSCPSAALLLAGAVGILPLMGQELYPYFLCLRMKSHIIFSTVLSALLTV